MESLAARLGFFEGYVLADRCEPVRCIRFEENWVVCYNFENEYFDVQVHALPFVFFQQELGE